MNTAKRGALSSIHSLRPHATLRAGLPDFFAS